MSNKFLGLDAINVFKEYIDSSIDRKLSTNKNTRSVNNTTYNVDSRSINHTNNVIYSTNDVTINNFIESTYYIANSNDTTKYTLYIDDTNSFNTLYNNKLCKFVNVGTGNMTILSPNVPITDNINITNEIVLLQGESVDFIGINDNECKFILVGKSIESVDEIIVEDIVR